jgi:hypothetical protein
MQNNLLIHADNLTGLNYLLDNGLRSDIDLRGRLEKSNFHNHRRAKRCLRLQDNECYPCLKGRTNKVVPLRAKMRYGIVLPQAVGIAVMKIKPFGLISRDKKQAI